MIIAHLADLHISKYGAKLTSMKNGRIKIAKGAGWAPLWIDGGWRVDVRRAKGRLRLRDAYRLVDRDGRVHQVVKLKGETSEAKIVRHLVQIRNIREKTASHTLARHWPDEQTICHMLQEDPENGNVRFCAVANALNRDKPDWIIVTGDLTDDGVGYELIRKGFHDYIKNKKLICIPGNHDLYPTPPIWTANALRKSEKAKRELWADFIQHLGLPAHGSYVVSLGEDVLLAFLDTLYPSKLPGSSSGHLPVKDLQQVARQLRRANPAAIRLACLHHPVLNMTHKELGLINYQPGMKIRNAKNALKDFERMNFSLVMKGHRHVGYKYHPENGAVFLSAPSTTYGCRTGAKPFYWKIDIQDREIKAIRKVKIETLEDPRYCK